MDQLSEVDFTVDNVFQALSQLDPTKARGCDQVRPSAPKQNWLTGTYLEGVEMKEEEEGGGNAHFKHLQLAIRSAFTTPPPPKKGKKDL